VQNIREGGDAGIPIMISGDEITKNAFTAFAAQTVRSISMLNAHIATAKVAEVVA